MLKAVLLDLDGTLVETLSMYIAAYKKALEQYGFSFSAQEISELCFGKKEEVICQKLGIPEKTEEFRKIYFATIDELTGRVELFPNVLEFLAKIKRKGIRPVLVSYAFKWYVDKIINQLGIRNQFEFLMCHEDVSEPKPNPEAVLKACDKMGVEPVNTLLIGDTRSDVLMGKAAGCRTVLFFPKENEEIYDIEKLKATNPDYIATTYDDLSRQLDL